MEVGWLEYDGWMGEWTGGRDTRQITPWRHVYPEIGKFGKGGGLEMTLNGGCNDTYSRRFFPTPLLAFCRIGQG